MVEHPRTYLEQLEPPDCEAIYQAALRILERGGLAVQSEEACRVLSDGGALVDRRDQRVRFPPDLVEKALAAAPRRWFLHARNPARTVELGADLLLVAPGYGSPFVAEEGGRRRQATMEDFLAFASLAGASEVIDITGGLLVEPQDVPAGLRPLETTRALIERSDKPFFGSVAGADGANESLELARVVFPDMDRKAVMLGLININSPLRLDPRMAGALLEYVKAGQPVLLTPGILMGVTAPVTIAGALSQALAELLGCVSLIQVLRPGAPVMIGTGGFGSDLRTGGPGFGRPENALATVLGAQMARRVGLPYRCSGAVTGARLPDCRSGYERMMTAMAAWSAGAHLCLQGAGKLDSINSMSFEQFLIDMEIWGYLKRLASQPQANPTALAAELIVSQPSDYLGSEHTLEHMHRELYCPSLAPAGSYEEWAAGGAPDAAFLAGLRLKEGSSRDRLPPMEEGLRRELDAYVRRRREGIKQHALMDCSGSV